MQYREGSATPGSSPFSNQSDVIRGANGETVTAADVRALQQWAEKAESQFTPEEYVRVKKALNYGDRRFSGPSRYMPRVTLSSAVFTAVAVVLAIMLWFTALGHAPQVISSSTKFSRVSGPLIVMVLACAALSVGWPKWLRVTALVVAGISLITFLPVGASFVWLLMAALVVFLFVQGGKR